MKADLGSNRNLHPDNEVPVRDLYAPRKSGVPAPADACGYLLRLGTMGGSGNQRRLQVTNGPGASCGLVRNDALIRPGRRWCPRRDTIRSWSSQGTFRASLGTTRRGDAVRVRRVPAQVQVVVMERVFGVAGRCVRRRTFRPAGRAPPGCPRTGAQSRPRPADGMTLAVRGRAGRPSSAVRRAGSGACCPDS
jgi:hypothetical protein